MKGIIKTSILLWFLGILFLIISCGILSDTSWKPNTDWGHWRLGHRSDFDFLEKNKFTVTFGSGAPNFENVSREEFEKEMEEAKQFNKTYHDSGYIVLRYLSTSLNGESETPTSEPRKDQIHMLDFYNNRWEKFEDYIGPKPSEDPTTWIMVRPDGSFPYYRYAPYGRETDRGFEAWGCPNNPHYVRMMKGRIRAQAETGIDGSYVDWTHIAGGTCYCKYCVQAFREYLNTHLPKEMAEKKYGSADYSTVELPKEKGDDYWMEFRQFRCYSVAQFHQKLRTAAREVNPHFLISGNVFGGFGYGPIAYDAAGNMEMLGKVDDFIYSEIQEYLDSTPRKDERGVKITNSPALKFLAAACSGKPVIEYATEITPPIFPKPTDEALSAIAQINIAEAAANHCVFREKRQTPEGATQIHQFLAKNENNLIGAHLESNIGILASLDQYLADELSFSFSLSRIFADHGIGHIMLVEQNLSQSETMKKLDMIIIPYLPLLSREVQNRLISFVKSGGHLLVLGASGVKNQYDVLYDEVPLLTLLESDSYPKSSVQKSKGKGTIHYIPLTIPDSKFLTAQKKKGDVTTFGPAMADVFPDIPEAYTRGNIHPALKNILELTVTKTTSILKGKYSQIKGSPLVEMTVMNNEQQNLKLVHLVNYDVTINGTVTAPSGLNVRIMIPDDKQIKTIHFSGSLSEMRGIPYKQTNKNGIKMASFSPELSGIYGLAVIFLE